MDFGLLSKNWYVQYRTAHTKAAYKKLSLIKKAFSLFTAEV